MCEDKKSALFHKQKVLPSAAQIVST